MDDKEGAATDAASALQPVPQARRVTITFSGLSAWVNVAQPVRDASFVSQWLKCRSNTVQTTKQILHKVWGTASPGQITGVLGPSGGGKSTLMAVCSGRSPADLQIEGKLHYNGRPPSKAIKRQVGFVHQDDTLYEMLTVRETLYYAAMLRLPAAMPAAEKVQRLDAVIAVLGLQRCVDTLIGGFLRRGVSGGERRRVSIGHELLVDPPLMLLDEPTSGLDATTAMSLMRALRALATGGRTIIATLHQPSSRVYHLLDTLLLLSDGHLLYNGPAAAAADWFQGQGHILPYGVSTGDWLLDLAAGQHAAADAAAGGGGGDCSSTDGSGGSSGAGDAAVRSDAVALLWRSCEAAAASAAADRGVVKDAAGEAEAAAVVEGGGARGAAGRDGARYVDQVRLLLGRTTKTRRFETMSWQKFAQTLGLGVICCVLWWRKAAGDESLRDAQDIVGLMFAEMQFLSFFTVFTALHTFSQHFRMLVKERSAGMYRLSAFFAARTAADLPVECALPTAFVAAVYWAAGLRPTVGAFAAHWGTLMALVLMAQPLGTLIGTVLLDAKNAQVLLSVVVLSTMLVAGYYVKHVPVWIGWVKYCSFYYWCFTLLLAAEYRGMTYEVCDDDSGVRVGCRRERAREALGLPRAPEESVWHAVGALVVFMVALRVACYVALKVRTRRC